MARVSKLQIGLGPGRSVPAVDSADAVDVSELGAALGARAGASGGGGALFHIVLAGAVLATRSHAQGQPALAASSRLR